MGRNRRGVKNSRRTRKMGSAERRRKKEEQVERGTGEKNLRSFLRFNYFAELSMDVIYNVYIYIFVGVHSVSMATDK